MRRVAPLLLVAAACVGKQIPMHNGYKSPHARPWRKARHLKFNNHLRARAEGDLSYPDRRRAAWFKIVLTQPSEIDLKVDITPGDGTDDTFDLGMEVLDPGYHVLVRKDKNQGDEEGDYTKDAKLPHLAPGKYLVHLYLQGRLDTADYILRASLKPSGAIAAKTDFPAHVPFLPALPMVPINDDTPKGYRPHVRVARGHHHYHHRHHTPTPKKPTPPSTTLTARILGLSVVHGGTRIVVGRGTASGAKAGMKGSVTGVPNGAFTLASCGARTCTATVSATPDQIKNSGHVVLTP